MRNQNFLFVDTTGGTTRCSEVDFRGALNLYVQSYEIHQEHAARTLVEARPGTCLIINTRGEENRQSGILIVGASLVVQSMDFLRSHQQGLYSSYGRRLVKARAR